MQINFSQNQKAKDALDLVRSLQARFVNKLNTLSKTHGSNKSFEEVLWQRNNGLNGGGSRFEARDETLFNTASVNVSQVHYDNEDKKLQSASAISTIIHFKNPNVPSIHIHISLTILKDNKAYWRIMADLNPSVVHDEDKNEFEKALKNLSLDKYDEGVKQGEKYFFIPALNRHRGISHFYLENFYTDNEKKDYEFALNFGEGIIDKYIEIITNALTNRQEISEKDLETQLDYHTLYLFQVLTLDRGTTSGLLIHSENDVGIMGSLPKYINKKLLNSWSKKVQKEQKSLVEMLVSVISDKGEINIQTKKNLASQVRKFYKINPNALSLQASGNTIPSTVANHHQKKD